MTAERKFSIKYDCSDKCPDGDYICGINCPDMTNVTVNEFLEEKQRSMIIDRKFKFIAFNPCNGKIYTEENALILCARDAAVLAALNQYILTCIDLGANEEHVESVKMLFQRVQAFQKENGAKVPDTVGQCELDRCIGGLNLDK